MSNDVKTKRLLHSLKIISQLIGILVVFIAAIALIGWLTGLRQLANIRSDYIPMAPNTALLFIVLGFSLYIFLFEKSWSYWLVRLCTIPVIIVAVFRFIEFSFSIDLKVDFWFFYFSDEPLGFIPVGKMALSTSINFFLAGLTLFLVSFSESKKPVYILAKIPAIAETLIGLAFTLGYVYGAPLLYGGTIIPMALNTAVNFVCLGMGFIIVIVGHDLKEHKEKEDALKNLNKELENYAKHLEYLNKELEAFTYSVSHDLQAPLRPIEGFSQIILRDYADKLDDRGRQLLNRICDSAQKMEQLIDDLLSFSRTGQKDMVFSEINMNELAGAVIEEIKTINGSSRLQFNGKPLPYVYGDLPMLRQVFVNLISNAVKFTAPKDTALIEIGCRTEDKENVCYVKDNGVGFDMKYADKLFGVFRRLHGEDEFKGTGIGLAIVKRIIHRHGGRVWAEGKANEGAAFYFTLPKTGNREQAINKPHHGSRCRGDE
ncbi:MAG: hypothetical protein HY097_10720 [Nitrospinae bacterium]|nr:hypothetical protein [Nitrospinota bacterium]MBI3815848.1 hypothetical protein [Nitrospinota bacterium]